MKRILTTILIITIVITANAQGGNDQNFFFRGEVFRAIAVIFTLWLFMFFILTILKRVLDHRLKNKIVDKGISENMASSILQTSPNEGKHINIKWFAILAGVGAGLAIVNYTQPLGIHSLAIMAFCISLSFLGYYLFLRQADK